MIANVGPPVNGRRGRSEQRHVGGGRDGRGADRVLKQDRFPRKLVDRRRGFSPVSVAGQVIGSQRVYGQEEDRDLEGGVRPLAAASREGDEKGEGKGGNEQPPETRLPAQKVKPFFRRGRAEGSHIYTNIT